jgi:2-keto-4-pentenoate hydratase/2-oxohepta-3-ene-1,7-dioic acid hydratase in catechol pathway
MAASFDFAQDAFVWGLFSTRVNMNIRIASFNMPQGNPSYGLVADDHVIDVGAAWSARYPALLDVIRAGQLTALAQEGAAQHPRYALSDITWQVPVAAPEKFICVGVNYAERNAEYKDADPPPKYPSLFVRFPDSFVGHLQPIVRPRESDQLDYEGEIVLLIGKAGRRIARDVAHEHIAALTLANEGSVRDWVRHGKFNVTPGKNFDQSGSLGPWLVPANEIDLTQPLSLTTCVNGELRQDDTTERMIFNFAALIEYISTFTTLKAGDVILTGTPTGSGGRLDPPRWLVPGDVVEVACPQIGVLKNFVSA